jgi:hypothetical protein
VLTRVEVVVGGEHVEAVDARRAGHDGARLTAQHAQLCGHAGESDDAAALTQARRYALNPWAGSFASSSNIAAHDVRA